MIFVFIQLQCLNHCILVRVLTANWPKKNDINWHMPLPWNMNPAAKSQGDYMNWGELWLSFKYRWHSNLFLTAKILGVFFIFQYYIQHWKTLSIALFTDFVFVFLLVLSLYFSLTLSLSISLSLSLSLSFDRSGHVSIGYVVSSSASSASVLRQGSVSSLSRHSVQPLWV